MRLGVGQRKSTLYLIVRSRPGGVLYGIVADDLTGALDAALPFAERGYRAGVLLAPRTTAGLGREQETALRAAGFALDVMALSTDSRSDTAEVAAEKACKAVAELKACGAGRLYKKIDSTLRGPFSAEIRAAMEASGRDVAAMVCPAFPEQGRTVRNGILHIHGVPLDTSPFGSPIPGVSSVAEIIEAALLQPVVHLPIETVEAGSEAVRRAIGGALRAGRRLFCGDATEASHLRAIAAAIDGLDVLPCGSAGLAGAIAGLSADYPLPSHTLDSRFHGNDGDRPLLVVEGFSGSPDAPRARIEFTFLPGRDPVEDLRGAASTRGKPVLIVAGSQHPATKAQARRLAQDGMAVLQWHGDDSASPARLLASGHNTLVELAFPGEQAALSSDRTYREARLGELAGAVKRCILQAGGLVISGGDTARAVLGALGAEALVIRGALEPGVPVCTIEGGMADGLPLVTKAGGFGGPDTLARAVRRLLEM